MTTTRRTYTYLLALAGLLVTISAAAGLLALVVSTLVLHSSTLLGDERSVASSYLAELVVGLPVWLGHWLVAERSLARNPEERDASQRRLYLAAVFAVSAVVALFALHTLLRVILTLPGADARQPLIATGISAAARLLIFGGAWAVHTPVDHQRFASRNSTAGVDDAHDLAVYVLTGTALVFLLIGLDQAIRQIVGDLLSAGQTELLVVAGQNLWTIWGAIAAWVLAGGTIWALVWQYDLARGGRRLLRVIYLYLVLLIAVPTTIGTGVDGLYELLRRLFGYQPLEATWAFLGSVLPPLLVAAGTWAYHWLTVRQQARYVSDVPAAPAAEGEPAAPERGVSGIAWPRRPGLALLALLGLGVSASAFVAVLWLGLDALINSAPSLSGSDWWRDRLSVSLAAGAVGAVAWFSGWWRLQRAATLVRQERGAQERRLLLGFIAVVGTLFAFGFLIALLWFAFRALLGVPVGAHGLSTALKEFSAALVALLLAAYHGLILRTDSSIEPGPPIPQRIRVLVSPGAEAMLAALRQDSSLQIEVAGWLLDDVRVAQRDLPALLARLTTAGPSQEGTQTLLVLGPDGPTIYRYRSER